MKKKKGLLLAALWGLGTVFLSPSVDAEEGGASPYARESDREIMAMTEKSPSPSGTPAPQASADKGQSAGMGNGEREEKVPEERGLHREKAVDTAGKDAAAKEKRRQWLDVAYGTQSPMQKMDIYLPETGIRPYPVVVLFHGRGEDKSSVDEDLRHMALSHGYALLCVNYREPGEARFPADVMDGKAAVRYLKANAAAYGLDASHIAAWGYAHGGKIASFLGTTSSHPEFEEASIGARGKSSRVNAVVAWFPELDDVHMDGDLRALGRRPALSRDEEAYGVEMYGAPVQSIPELASFANPARYVGPDASPFFLLHGRADDVSPISQSEAFADQLRHTIGSNNVALLSLEGAGHQLKGFLAKDVMDKVFGFMDKRLKVKPKKKNT